MRTVEDFVARITQFHRRRPKFRATVAASVAPMVDVAALLEAIPPAYDLDTAIGAQLDRVGEWVGYSRDVVYPLPHAWFSFGDPSRGFGKGRWKTPEDPKTGVIRLDDDIYRQLLRAKVLLNHWDGRAASAGVIFETFLDDPDTFSFLVDKHNGTQRLGIAGEIPSTQRLQMLAQDYLSARPAGIASKTLVTSVNRAPLFGFGVQNHKISGFGTGAWAVTPEFIIDNGYTARRPRPSGSPDPVIARKPPRFGFGSQTTTIAGFGRGVWSHPAA